MWTMGYAPFKAPGLGDDKVSTWYKIFGDLESDCVPLVILHGGPSASHKYLQALEDLYEQFNIPIVFYDQVGNGNSTSLPAKSNDASIWTSSLFIAELKNLIDHLGLDKKGYDLYGHSWGAMFGSEFAASKPVGLRKLILASGPASMEVWLKGLNGLRAKLPKDVQDVLDEGERERNFTSPEYEAAMDVFFKRHLCRIEPYPAREVEDALQYMMGEGSVWGTMYGKSELFVDGTLKDWTAVPGLPQITAQTLLLNGRYDEATNICMQPFFDKIPNVRWITLEDSSHFAHVEKRERYMTILAEFLAT